MHLKLDSDVNTNWYVYIVECSDSSLYTGITIDIDRRVHEHNSTLKGAKSLRFKRPVSLVHFELYNSHLDAARREMEIKSWDRNKKLKLISGR